MLGGTIAAYAPAGAGVPTQLTTEALVTWAFLAAITGGIAFIGWTVRTYVKAIEDRFRDGENRLNDLDKTLAALKGEHDALCDGGHVHRRVGDA